MSDDDETHLHVTYATHWDMDEAFCARLRSVDSSGAGKCVDWCDHRARNENSKIRSSRASTTSLPIGQYELLVGLVGPAFHSPRISMHRYRPLANSGLSAMQK